MAEFSPIPLPLEYRENARAYAPLSIHLFPGIGATHRGMENTLQALKTVPGADRIRVENSFLFSKDPPTPQRFAHAGDRILETYRRYEETGLPGKVIIAMNSGAGGEFPAVWHHMLDKDPGLVEKYIKDTHFLLTGTTGLQEGAGGLLRTLKRLNTLMHSQLGQWFVEKNPSEVAGIETMYIYDSPHLDNEGLNGTLHKVFPERSHRRDGIRILDHQPNHRFYNELPDEVKTHVEEVDRRINELASSLDTNNITENDRRRMKELLRQRTGILNKGSETAWNGPPVQTESPADEDGKNFMKKFAVGLLAFKDTVTGVRSIIAGSTGKILEDLRDYGLPDSHFHYLMPEYDVFVTFEDLLRSKPFWTEDELKKISSVMERGTHAGWAPLGDPLARAVKVIYDRPV